MDTKGKIAVYIAGAPSSMSSALAAHYQSAAQRWAALKSAGMIGAITILNPHHMDIPWPRIALNRFQMTMQAGRAGMDETAGEQIAVTWNPAHADRNCSRARATASMNWWTWPKSGKQFRDSRIPARIKARTAVQRGSVESQNLAAIYPGSDAKLKRRIRGDVRAHRPPGNRQAHQRGHDLQRRDGQRGGSGLGSGSGRPLEGSRT